MPLLGSSTADGTPAVYHDLDPITRPMARTRATLLSVAKQIPAEMLSRNGTNRHAAGVEWLPWPDHVVNRDAVNCDTTYTKDARSLPDLATQPSFLLWDRLQCSTAGLEIEWLAEAIEMELDEFASAHFASELEDAAGSGGVGLIGNATYTPTVVTSSAVSVVVALALLEGYLATGSGKPGMLGVIHLTPRALLLAVADGAVEYRDGAYRTPSGHVVIGDAGHTGADAPHGQSGPGTNEAWVYATGDVWYAQGAISGVMAVEQDDGGAVYVAQNKNRPLGERTGLVVFDPNVLGAALVDLEAGA